MANLDPLSRPRRFWTTAQAGESDDGAFCVLLDGRRARTPVGSLLAAPTRALAELIAREWAAQQEVIEPATMVATRLASQAIDGGAAAREVQARALVRYGLNDLVCYFAEAPARLRARQETVWGPLLDWAREAQGLDLLRAEGVIHRAQPAAAAQRLEAIAARSDPWALAGLAFGASLFGSAIIVLALRAGRLDAQGAMDAARLDEVFQEEAWGVDAEAARRTEAMAAEAEVLERWFRALPG